MSWFKDLAKQVSDIVAPVTEIAPEFDPTNPDADYGDLTSIAGDAVINAYTGGTGGTVFSDGSQLIQDMNEVTDNTFTLNNIEDTADDFDLNWDL